MSTIEELEDLVGEQDADDRESGPRLKRPVSSRFPFCCFAPATAPQMLWLIMKLVSPAAAE